MWSDRPSPAPRRELVDRLRKILPTGERDAVPATGDFVWLDRPGRGELAANPIARLSVAAGIATICGPCGRVQVEARGFDLIEAALEAWGGLGEARLFGYLGYELGAELEDVPHQTAGPGDLPDLCLGLYEEWGRKPDRFLRVAARKIALTSKPSDQGFCDAVARTVNRIHNGELFQVNLCRRLETDLPETDILPLYHRLREITPASYGAFLQIGASAVLSASPELFLSVRNGRVRTCPIKGTRPRGANPNEDRALVSSLLSSEKDRAELAMIVDVARNDLGRVCRARSVSVDRHAELMTLPTVHHTYSEVSGQLRDGCSAADLLRASFPPASISGAPKIRAMEVAAMEEGYRRGPAMGSIGWIAMNGDMELSVAIRTAVASQGQVYYLAGCGITAESLPEEELAESKAKAAAFLKALETLSEPEPQHHR
ncbi:MAG: anthranilate synthase component I family protein [Acidobacteriia bacterium]|nr:anthranilate synthase component I family protein [Terriglobia bacterium]